MHQILIAEFRQSGRAFFARIRPGGLDVELLLEHPRHLDGARPRVAGALAVVEGAVNRVGADAPGNIWEFWSYRIVDISCDTTAGSRGMGGSTALISPRALR